MFIQRGANFNIIGQLFGVNSACVMQDCWMFGSVLMDGIVSVEPTLGIPADGTLTADTLYIPNMKDVPAPPGGFNAAFCGASWTTP